MVCDFSSRSPPVCCRAAVSTKPAMSLAWHLSWLGHPRALYRSYGLIRRHSRLLYELLGRRGELRWRAETGRGASEGEWLRRYEMRFSRQTECMVIGWFVVSDFGQGVRFGQMYSYVLWCVWVRPRLSCLALYCIIFARLIFTHSVLSRPLSLPISSYIIPFSHPPWSLVPRPAARFSSQQDAICSILILRQRQKKATGSSEPQRDTNSGSVVEHVVTVAVAR